jgi:glycosyltransferase involved in cell wall biosynthesis
MRILLLGEYSGLQNQLKAGLVALGHEVTLAASNDFWKKLPVDLSLGHGSNLYSYKLRQLLLPIININRLTNYDVVHLVSFYSIPRLPYLNYLFVKFLKKNNKVVTLSGAGDEPFFVKYSTETMRYSPIPTYESIDLKKPYYMRKKNHLVWFEKSLKFVDRIIPIMYEYYSTFKRAGYIDILENPIPIPIDLSARQNKIALRSEGKKLVFFHGLNRPGFKGSHIVNDAFVAAAKEFSSSASFHIDGNLPFEQYRNLIDKTNIMVDQLFSYSLAMNALFSMAQGKVVLGGNEPESRVLYNNESPPVFNVLPDAAALLETIREVISRKNEIPEMSQASIEFVKKHHDALKVASRYVDIWQKLL